MSQPQPALPRYVTAVLEDLAAPNSETAIVPASGMLVGSAYLVIPDLGGVHHWDLGTWLAPGDTINITLHLTISCEAGTAGADATPGGVADSDSSS